MIIPLMDRVLMKAIKNTNRTPEGTKGENKSKNNKNNYNEWMKKGPATPLATTETN
jgi:co-chaperonin GroES (HSP10)